MMHELLKLVVVEAKMVSYEYFLDVMQEWEVEMLIPYIGNSFRAMWEMTRNQVWMIAQTNSTKRIKPTDIMKFSWDKEAEVDTKISTEDIERLKARSGAMKERIQRLQSQK